MNKTQRLDEAEKCYKEALEIQRSFAKIEPLNYDVYVSMTLNNIALLDYKMQKFDDAERTSKKRWRLNASWPRLTLRDIRAILL